MNKPSIRNAAAIIIRIRKVFRLESVFVASVMISPSLEAATPAMIPAAATVTPIPILPSSISASRIWERAFLSAVFHSVLETSFRLDVLSGDSREALRQPDYCPTAFAETAAFGNCPGVLPIRLKAK